MVLFVSKIGMDGLDGWMDGKLGYRTPYGVNNLFVDVFFIKDVTIKVCALQKRGYLCKINVKIYEINVINATCSLRMWRAQCRCR